MDFGFVAVPAITIICYLVAEIFKSADKADEHKKFIPTVCGICGLILAVTAYYVAPTLIDADNIFISAAIGVVSGFAATGVNQVIKQLSNSSTEVEEE